jgi:hypothetical protein
MTDSGPVAPAISPLIRKEKIQIMHYINLDKANKNVLKCYFQIIFKNFHSLEPPEVQHGAFFKDSETLQWTEVYRFFLIYIPGYLSAY